MLDKLNQLTESHGELRRVHGLVSGVISLSLANQLMYWSLVQSDRVWPAQYGVVGDCVPDGFWKQLAFPFVWRQKG